MQARDQDIYFRSMSSTEYEHWQTQGSIDEQTEWTSLTLSRNQQGYRIKDLKEWADQGRNEHGPHDVIIKLEHAKPGDFYLVTNAERWKHGSTDYDLIKPLRYMNTYNIPFSTTQLIYDPRASIANNPIDNLEEYLKNPSFWSEIKDVFKKR